jgi:hypothetical protein
MTEDETSKKLEKIIVEASDTPLAHTDPASALRDLVVICQSLNERIGQLEKERFGKQRGGAPPGCATVPCIRSIAGVILEGA